MSALIPTMLRFRDIAKSRALAPDATYVILVASAVGESATFVDHVNYVEHAIEGYYDCKLVIALPLDADWSVHTVDAVEMVDAATVEAGIMERTRTLLWQAGFGDALPDDDQHRRPF